MVQCNHTSKVWNHQNLAKLSTSDDWGLNKPNQQQAREMGLSSGGSSLEETKKKKYRPGPYKIVLCHAFVFVRGTHQKRRGSQLYGRGVSYGIMITFLLFLLASRLDRGCFFYGEPSPAISVQFSYISEFNKNVNTFGFHDCVHVRLCARTTDATQGLFIIFE